MFINGVNSKHIITVDVYAKLLNNTFVVYAETTIGSIELQVFDSKEQADKYLSKVLKLLKNREVKG